MLCLVLNALTVLKQNEEFTRCFTCNDLFHSVQHCLNSQKTVSNNSVFKCQNCNLLMFPNLVDTEIKTRDVFSKSDMDRLNQLKINPFALNKKVALNENNENLDMLNDLNSVDYNYYYTPVKFKQQAMNENTEDFFLFLNIRSISNKFDGFKQLIKNTSVL